VAESIDNRQKQDSITGMNDGGISANQLAKAWTGDGGVLQLVYSAKTFIKHNHYLLLLSISLINDAIF
jgi:hypothetical protein